MSEKNILSKKELIALIARKADISKKDTETVMETFWELVKDSLKNGIPVRYIPYGSFEARLRTGRAGINPVTHEKIQIPSKKIPSFRAGKALKEVLE